MNYNMKTTKIEQVLKNQELILEKLANIQFTQWDILKRVASLEVEYELKSYEEKVLSIFNSYCIRNSSSNALKTINSMFRESQELAKDL